MDQNIVLKIGNLELTLEQAIKEGIAQVLNAKVYISTDKALQLILPPGMKLSKEGVLLLDNGEDVQVTILDENGESILLILKGMGTILATYDATNGDPLPFQVFQLGQQKLAFATLDDLTPAAAAGPQEGNQNQNSQQEDSNSNLQDYNQNNPNTNNPVVNGPVNDLTPRTTPTPIAENIIEIDTPAPNNAPVIDAITAVSANEDDSIISGTVTSSDVDAGATATYSAPTTAGFTLNSSTGAYTFDPSDAAYQSLALGEALTVTIPVTVTDDQGATASTDIVINLTGTNDAATITVADDSISEGSATVSGTATSTDVDNTNNSFTAVTDIASTNGYGTYSVTSAGVWTYTLDNTNTTVDALSVGDTLADTITVTSVDGTTETVTITINGADETTTNTAPQATATEETISEDDFTANVYSGTLTATDTDGDTLTYERDTNAASTLTISSTETVESFNDLATLALRLFAIEAIDTALTNGTNAYSGIDVSQVAANLLATNPTAEISDVVTYLNSQLGGLASLTIDVTTNEPTFTINDISGMETDNTLNISISEGAYTVTSTLFDALNSSETAVLNFGYTVDDGSGESNSSDSSTVALTINGADETTTNTAPQATATEETISEDDFTANVYSGTLTATDTDGDTLTYERDTNAASTLTISSTETVESFNDLATLALRLFAIEAIDTALTNGTNAYSGIDVSQVAANLLATNPTAEISDVVTYLNSQLGGLASLTIDVTTNEPTFTINDISGMETDNTLNISISEGAYTVTSTLFDALNSSETAVLNFGYTVDDGSGESNSSDSSTVALTINGADETTTNTAPQATATEETISEDDFTANVYSGTLTATDTDGDTLTYERDTNAASTLTISSTETVESFNDLATLALRLFAIEAIDTALTNGTNAYSGIDVSQVAANLLATNPTAEISDVVTYLNSQLGGLASLTIDVTTNEPTFTINDISGMETDNTLNISISEGAYTVTSTLFDALNSSETAVLNFGYTVDDGSGESNSSDSSTVALTINGADEILDLATLLSNVSDLDEVNITSGDHILSNLSVDEYIALTDEDNTLKIIGDTGDTIQLDSNWSKMMETDGSTPYTDSEGYAIYTAQNSANETVKLLIQEDINVSII